MILFTIEKSHSLDFHSGGPIRFLRRRFRPCSRCFNPPWLWLIGVPIFRQRWPSEVTHNIQTARLGLLTDGSCCGQFDNIRMYVNRYFYLSRWGVCYKFSMMMMMMMIVMWWWWCLAKEGGGAWRPWWRFPVRARGGLGSVGRDEIMCWTRTWMEDD